MKQLKELAKNSFQIFTTAMLIFSLALAPALANDNDGGNGNDNKGSRNLPALIDPAVVHDMLKAGMNESSPLDERTHTLLYVANYPYKEVADTLLAIFAVEVDRKGGGATGERKISYRLIATLVEAMGKNLTVHEKQDFLDGLGILASHIQEFTNAQQEELSYLIETAREKISARTEALSELPKNSNRRADEGLSLKEKRDKFRASLEKEIKGQAHVVEKLLNLRSRDNFYGYRETPAFMWFMGPPGTGKDTAVRGYLSAVHQDAKAFEDHMYRVDPLRQEGDLWSFLGSATGYKGSDELPPVIKFLVAHSGGRYKIEEVREPMGKTSYRVVKNDMWKEGRVLPGYNSPDQGAIYFDEFHDWSKAFKNAIVKKAVEYEGYWKINNPNGGVAEIYVPINIFASSNDGIELITSREKNGERFGKPLSYKEMKSKADVVRNDPTALRGSILKGNEADGGENAKGTSEELLNRVPEEFLVLFDPISPESLQEIADAKLEGLRARIQKSKTGFSEVNLTWTPEVLRFLQEYHYVAEDQARPIENKVRSMIENTIVKASEQDLIKPGEKVNMLIDVKQQPDNSWKMIFQVKGLENSVSEDRLFELEIEATAADRARQPISDEKIDELAQLPANMKKNIVGQSHVLDKVARAIILSEEGRAGVITTADAKDPARVFMFLGPTSTGKTETSKIIALELFKDRNAAVTIDCTSLQTIEAMQHKFLGHKEGGKVIASDFMKHYDRNNGHLVVVLDELANVKNKEVINSLFDILREPVVTTFSDGQERIMSNVIIVITGNASQEILASLPQDLPEDVLREAWADIYDQLEMDPHMRRGVLEGYFTPPFIARIGDDRIFFYKPLGYADVRRLVQMKFESLIDGLEPKEGRRGWNVRINGEKEYIQVMEALETHGFRVKEQGASIDHYVREVFGKELRAQLLLSKVPNGADVELSFVEAKQKETENGERHILIFNAKASNGQSVQVEVQGRPVEHISEKLKTDQITTAGHEAGHAVVGMALLSDFTIPTQVRILPGVTRIGDEWIYYAGVASSEEIREARVTREYILRRIAVLMGGTVAESLITKGGLNSAGRSNDIERATRLAKMAILEFGMSARFGMQKIDEHDLSDGDKRMLREEVQAMIQEGTDLARRSIMANKDLFVQLMNELAGKGMLKKSEIAALMQQYGVVKDHDENFERLSDQNKEQFNTSQTMSRAGLKYEFVDTLPIIEEKDVADIYEMVQARKKKELGSVKIPNDAALSGRPSKKSNICAELISK